MNVYFGDYDPTSGETSRNWGCHVLEISGPRQPGVTQESINTQMLRIPSAGQMALAFNNSPYQLLRDESTTQSGVEMLRLEGASDHPDSGVSWVASQAFAIAREEDVLLVIVDCMIVTFNFRAQPEMNAILDSVDIYIPAPPKP
jgi:hypothetical protein